MIRAVHQYLWGKKYIYILVNFIIYKSIYTMAVCVHLCTFFFHFLTTVFIKSKYFFVVVVEIVGDFIWTTGYCANISSAVILLKS